MADGDKTYKVTIHVNSVGSDGKVMFDSNVTYENMHYQDVVLVEKALVNVLQSLNEFAEKRPDKQKPKKNK